MVLGKRRSEFIDSAAGHHMADVPARAGSDFDVARVMSVFDPTVGVTAAQPLFRCPEVVGIAPPSLVKIGPMTVGMARSEMEF